MKIYADFTEAGEALAFYASASHGERTRPVCGDADPETGEAPVVGEEPNPHCLVPASAIEISNADWRELRDNPGRRRWQDGAVVEYEPPQPAPGLDDYRRAIQAHIDATAQDRSYDSGITCASYVGSTNSAWAAEAQAFVTWRDGVWAYVYAALADVQSGERTQPSIAEMIDELPEIDWPG